MHGGPGRAKGSLKPVRRRPALLTLVGVPLLLAGSDVKLTPGLWELVNTPGVATLDGRELDDLPLGPIKKQEVCLAAAEAADPAAFFARDTTADCRITRASLAGGKVDIAGACPNPEEGNEGALTLTGRFAPDRYELDFATRAEDFQGVMTFNGKLTGRRIGHCPKQEGPR
jgi:hypothetical protein